MNGDDMIISTRIRLARNVDGLPFPQKCGERAARDIVNKVEEMLIPVDKFTRYDIAGLSDVDGNALREKHLISSDLLTDSPFGAALVSADETVSVMVNEEDHIREQVIMDGLSLDQAYDKIAKIDDVIGNGIRFAYSPRFGYLTACATNLGTGMRASVMMFLPALTIGRRIDACINDVGRLNMTVRGVYGEGSEAEGYLFQISNQRTLGVTEEEILDSVKSAINHIAEAEIAARSMLLRNEIALKDKIFRAYGIASNAYSLSSGEAMELLALIRLGGYYGYMDVSDRRELQRLVTSCQPASIQRYAGQQISESDRDILRAKYISTALGKIVKRNA